MACIDSANPNIRAKFLSLLDGGGGLYALLYELSMIARF